MLMQNQKRFELPKNVTDFSGMHIDVQIKNYVHDSYYNYIHIYINNSTSLPI